MNQYTENQYVNVKINNFDQLMRITKLGVEQVTVSDGNDLYDVPYADINPIDPFNTKDAENCKHDPVNHPSHYTDGKIEVIDFINDKKMNFNRGNVIKYVSRAGKKASKALDDKKKEIQDLEKAAFYLNDEIKRLKQELEDND